MSAGSPLTVAATNPAAAFSINRWIHALGGFVERHPAWMVRLGGLESRLLAEQLAGISIEQPIFIAGLADRVRRSCSK